MEIFHQIETLLQKQEKVHLKCWPEYSLEFFELIFDWLKRFTAQEGRKITLNFQMHYFIKMPI
ncbi:MAG: DUF1987 domain-containing protein [Bacteroidia bacterium]|nr:DUF1987 domain-containing protein [Bacteroidia bacterium]